MKRIIMFSQLLILTGSSLTALGTNREVNFDIGEYHSVDVHIPCTIILNKADEFLMDIEDRTDRIRDLHIYNDRGTLVFKLKEKNLLKRLKKEDLNIVLTMPEWKKIRLSSSADLKSDDFWENPEISVISSASGNISLADIKAETAEIKASGSGDITLGDINLKGPAVLNSSASGDIKTDAVSAASMKIGNSASGEIEMGDVDVSEGMFEVKSKGSGDSSFGAVRARNIRIIGRGSGEFLGDFYSDSLEVNLSGSGDAELSGKTGIASLKSSGSASIDASEMVIGEANIAGSGSGDIFLKQNTGIREVSFSGSGSLKTR